MKELNKLHVYETEKITRKASDTAEYIELFSYFTRDPHAWRSRAKEPNNSRYILPRHWLYEWFSQFHRRETYSVLSRSHSINFILDPRILNRIITIAGWGGCLSLRMFLVFHMDSLTFRLKSAVAECRECTDVAHTDTVISSVWYSDVFSRSGSLSADVFCRVFAVHIFSRNWPVT